MSGGRGKISFKVKPSQVLTLSCHSGPYVAMLWPQMCTMSHVRLGKICLSA